MVAEEGRLYRIRHSVAHVLAQAVVTIRPNARLAFGPPTEQGCYYDFLLDVPLTPEDFSEIENLMRDSIRRREGFTQSQMSPDNALALFCRNEQCFKEEYCRELLAQGETAITFYQNGNFMDMCAGPHVEHTGEIPLDSFCVDSVAGAYWRGDEKNPQLTRVYCLVFETKEELKLYLERRRLAQERDHRKLGRELDLFVLSDDVGPGLPLWTPNGTAIRDALEDYAKEVEAHAGYQRVCTPHLAKEQLYLESGHLPMYKDSMFPPMEPKDESRYYLKPMNCPHHHILFRSRPRSYRELPLRYAEYGTVYRYEASGTLSGLLRVRSIAQNDAHIYCAPQHLKGEVKATVKMTLDYYYKFRFEDIKMRFSKWDPQRVGEFIDNPNAWKHTESVMQEILTELGAEYYVGMGEAAFYGPKFDFQAKTGLGREETISTTQLDFGQPDRFNLRVVGEDGLEHMPYVIHRAPLGAHERFIAFLIEHFGGAFPTWMAPVQVHIIPVSDKFLEYGKKIEALLRARTFRVQVDWSQSTLNKKIRNAIVSKIPNIVIVGQREVEDNRVTLRRYCKKDQQSICLDTFISRLEWLRKNRFMDNFADLDLDNISPS